MGACLYLTLCNALAAATILTITCGGRVIVAPSYFSKLLSSAFTGRWKSNSHRNKLLCEPRNLEIWWYNNSSPYVMAKWMEGQIGQIPLQTSIVSSQILRRTLMFVYLYLNTPVDPFAYQLRQGSGLSIQSLWDPTWQVFMQEIACFHWDSMNYKSQFTECMKTCCSPYGNVCCIEFCKICNMFEQTTTLF